MSNNPNSYEEIPVVAVPRRQAAAGNHGLSSTDHWWRGSSIPRALTYRPEPVMDPWLSFEERVRTGPFGLTGFPSHPHSPIYILTIRNESAGDLNPNLIAFVRQSPPRVRGHWHLSLPMEEPTATLTQQEFNQVMKKMKKKVYKPKPTATRAFFKKKSNNNNNDDDEVEECIFCLEKFAPGEEVLVTPCNHIFHSGCLQPWLKSHGKCPTCRLAFSRRSEELSVANAFTDDSNNDDVLALVRAMEEAFSWINHSH